MMRASEPPHRRGYCASLSANVSGEKAPADAQAFGKLGISADSLPEPSRCLLEQRLAFQELKELLQICDGRVQFVIEPITCVGDVHRASVAFRRGLDADQPEIARRPDMPRKSKTPIKTNRTRSPIAARPACSLTQEHSQSAKRPTTQIFFDYSWCSRWEKLRLLSPCERGNCSIQSL
jgi:hypothetical protein